MKYLGLSAILALATAQAIALESIANIPCKPSVESTAQDFNKKSKEYAPLLHQENHLLNKSRMEKRPVDMSRFVQMTSALNAAKLELCAKFEDAYEEKDSCSYKDSEGIEVIVSGDDLLKDCKAITKVTESK